jgi:hypothetical protein
MAAANQKAQVQIAAAALHSFGAMCDSGTHLIPIHTLPDKQSAALLESCVDALKKLNAECESAFKCVPASSSSPCCISTCRRFLRQQTQSDPFAAIAADLASRYSTVGSDIRQSVSSKWQTVRRSVLLRNQFAIGVFERCLTSLSSSFAGKTAGI